MKQLIANTNSTAIEATEDGTERYFAYSGLDVIAELDKNKDITEFYVRGLGLGGGIGDIIAEVRTDSTNYYSYNHRGDVVLVTDSQCDTTATYEYTAFGEPILNSDTLYDRFLGFSSKEYDIKSGLSYYGFRYYDPSSTRWMKKDPIGFSGGINLYGFVYNNPVFYFDIYGLENERCIACELIIFCGHGARSGPEGSSRAADHFRNVKKSNVIKGARFFTCYAALYNEALKKEDKLEGEKEYGVGIKSTIGRSYNEKHCIKLHNKYTENNGLLLYAKCQTSRYKDCATIALKVEWISNIDEERPTEKTPGIMVDCTQPHKSNKN